jgi:hypothetical protein
MRAALALANYTGWSLSEIDSMPTDEFVEWVTKIPTPRHGRS